MLHIPHAHSMFVTGLQFLPITNEEGPPISSDTEAAVLSISVDNKVCIHSLPQRRKYLLEVPSKSIANLMPYFFAGTIPAWLAILFMIVMIFVVFVFCSYIGI